MALKIKKLTRVVCVPMIDLLFCRLLCLLCFGEKLQIDYSLKEDNLMYDVESTGIMLLGGVEKK